MNEKQKIQNEELKNVAGGVADLTEKAACFFCDNKEYTREECIPESLPSLIPGVPRAIVYYCPVHKNVGLFRDNYIN